MSEDSGSASYPSKEDLEQRAESGDPVARISVKARPIATGPLAHLPDASPTERRGRKMSATVLRLAKRLGRNADELAEKIPDDTVRRTKYRVLEEPQPDGSILYKEIKVK